MTATIRTAIRVEGIVQGVGFRPFVYTLATDLGLSGFVGNDVDGVFVEVEGPSAVVGEFLHQLERDPPPLARIERVIATAVAPRGTTSFAIAASGPPGTRRTLVSADTATCRDCLRELTDPDDRRFGYPFINCTNCGPRFTIVRDVPVRPAADHHGALCDVRAVRGRIPRPGRPPLPRPAHLLPGLRAAAHAARPRRSPAPR